MLKIIVFTKKYLKTHKFKLIFYYFLSSISIIISLILPKISGEFTDILVTGSKNDLFSYIFVYIFINICSIGISFIVNRLYIYIQSNAAFSLNQKINEHIWDISLLESCKYDSQYLADRINNDSNLLIIYSISCILNIFTIISYSIFSSFILFSINKLIFIVILISAFAYACFYFLSKDKIYRMNYELNDAKSYFSSSIFRQLDKILSIKIHANYRKIKENLNNSFKLLFDRTIHNSDINYLFSTIDTIIQESTSIFILIYGGLSVINKSISLGEFIMLNSYFSIIMGVVKSSFSLAKETQTAKVSFDRIIELVAIKEDINGNIKLNSIKQIDIDISFKYDKLRHFNFKNSLKKGKIYKILGENGEGKSTYLYNIIDIYISDIRGNILYNGIDIKNINMKYMRRYKIGFVEQNTFINEYDFENNVASEQANLIIESLDLKEIIKLNGDMIEYIKPQNQISGGQIQKIKIIKELVKNPELLILDEPINNLDLKSSIKIKGFLNNFKKNAIIVLVDHSNILDDIVDEFISI